MAGRRLDLTQRQVRALCEGAKRAGFMPVIKIGDMIVHLVPEERAVELLAKGEAFEEEMIIEL